MMAKSMHFEPFERNDDNGQKVPVCGETVDIVENRRNIEREIINSNYQR